MYIIYGEYIKYSHDIHPARLIVTYYNIYIVLYRSVGRLYIIRTYI